MTKPCRSAAGPAILLAVALAVCPGAGLAQAPEPAGLPTRATLEQRAARRFPQPVQVGDLAGRRLIGPTVSQPILGRIASVARGPDGRMSVVVRLAGWVWERDRSVAVPVEAVALLGEHVALLDLTADQLRGLPSFDPASGQEVAREAKVRIGLAKPFH